MKLVTLQNYLSHTMAYITVPNLYFNHVALSDSIESHYVTIGLPKRS